MQTFLPYEDFSSSAAHLDTKRLGKQRVEAYQILRALHGLTRGWVNHPATKMWRGYEQALVLYGIAACEEWLHRSYKDTTMAKIAAYQTTNTPEMPPWLGDERLHASHRSNLLRKDPHHYGPYGWSESSDLPYYWPV